MKLKGFILISALSLGGFFFLNWQSSRLPAPMPEEAIRGKQVWQAYNCVSCHTIFGNGGYVGDDMTTIVNKRSDEELLDFFVNPPVMRPNRQRRHPHVPKEDAIPLIQYFKFLSSIPTLGWPPKGALTGRRP